MSRHSPTDLSSLRSQVVIPVPAAAAAPRPSTPEEQHPHPHLADRRERHPPPQRQPSLWCSCSLLLACITHCTAICSAARPSPEQHPNPTFPIRHYLVLYSILSLGPFTARHTSRCMRDPSLSPRDICAPIESSRQSYIFQLGSARRILNLESVCRGANPSRT